MMIVGALLLAYVLKSNQLAKGPQVLFIGNSYTFSNDLPKMFTKLARSGGHDVGTELLANGGWTLEEHAQVSESVELIRQGTWNYVVLQEQSIVPSKPVERVQSMYPAVRILNEEIANNGASTILFMTWGRREGLSQLGYRNFYEMQNELAIGYWNIARQLDIVVSPVGLAWQRALQREPQIDLWQSDGSHPSVEGSYLAACVFYAVLFRESPEGLSYRAGLAEDMAGFLQSVAAEIVIE